MKLLIELPDEFESHFAADKFQDSLERVLCDIAVPFQLSGNYEYELIEALKFSFDNAVIVHFPEVLYKYTD